jgi:hypothetical protein
MGGHLLESPLGDVHRGAGHTLNGVRVQYFQDGLNDNPHERSVEPDKWLTAALKRPGVR